MDSVDEIRDLIRRGNIRRALKMVIDLPGVPTENLKEVDLLSNRFEKNERDRMMGVVSFGDYNMRSNQIVASILDLLGRIYDTADQVEEDTSQQASEQSPQNTNQVADGIKQIYWFESSYHGDSEIAMTEWRAIRESHRNSPLESQFRLDGLFAAQAFNLVWELENRLAYAVHFSGHGNKKGIVLRREGEKMYNHSAEDLMRVFYLMQGVPELVFLNNCFGKDIALSLRKKLRYILVHDEFVAGGYTATFSSTFYRYLFIGRSIEESFERAFMVAKPEKGEFGEAVLYLPNGKEFVPFDF